MSILGRALDTGFSALTWVGNKVGFGASALLMPIPVTFFGLMAVPYFVSGAHRHDYSGDGSLPFSICFVGMLAAGMLALLGSFPLLSLGIPLFASIPALYYLIIAGFFLWIWSK